MVQPMLCQDCNSRRLSKLDQSLAERSLVALSRVAFTPASAFDVRLGGDFFHVDEQTCLVLELALTNEMYPEVLPQVHLAKRPDGTRAVTFIVKSVEDGERLTHFVSDHIAKGTLRSIHVKIDSRPEAGSVCRLVMHRQRDGFVRAQSDADAAWFFQVLETEWPGAARQYLANTSSGRVTVTERPGPTKVSAHLSIPVNDLNRAVAKIAFNVLAVRLGVPFVLASEFDELRRYILGEVLPLAPDSEEEGAIDTRFVDMLPLETPPLIPTEEHAVTITYVAPVLYAWVTLYKVHQFIVRVGEILLNEPIMVVHEFSTDRQGNAELDAIEIIGRLRQWKP